MIHCFPPSATRRSSMTRLIDRFAAMTMTMSPATTASGPAVRSPVTATGLSSLYLLACAIDAFRGQHV